jgi:hypothetical protein
MKHIMTKMVLCMIRLVQLLQPHLRQKYEHLKKIDGMSRAGFCNASCKILMLCVGFENQIYEYKCGARPEECSHSDMCPQYRAILCDSGYFSIYRMKLSK